MALRDVGRGINFFGAAFFIAWQETKQRYRRSILGPFWITLSMFLMLLFMGPLYSKLFNQSPSNYFLSLSIGMIYWNFISGSIVDTSSAFINSQSLIKQINLPYSFYIIKSIIKNLIILGHNFILILLIIFINYKYLDIYNLLQFILGMSLILSNLLWIGFVLAMLCTRYRDMNQLITSGLQIIFFVTPIVWVQGLLNGPKIFLNVNIFYHLINVVREPLMGNEFPKFSFIYLLCSSIIGLFICFIIFASSRKKISYWI